MDRYLIDHRFLEAAAAEEPEEEEEEEEEEIWTRGWRWSNCTGTHPCMLAPTWLGSVKGGKQLQARMDGRGEGGGREEAGYSVDKPGGGWWWWWGGSGDGG